MNDSSPYGNFIETGSVHREDIEWTDVWIVDGQGTDLPRALLIGDSITRAYYPLVAQNLKGEVSVSRVATSKSLGDAGLADELIPTLKTYPWDVVHFNNGLHGWGYTEEEYAQAYPAIVALIQHHVPDVRIVIATSTPVIDEPSRTMDNPRTARIIVRNETAVGVAHEQKLPINDLFQLSFGHPEHYSADGVHFSQDGIKVQAAQVAAAIISVLESHQN